MYPMGNMMCILFAGLLIDFTLKTVFFILVVMVTDSVVRNVVRNLWNVFLLTRNIFISDL